ncbi:MAG: pilus assembly protein N-terminal domain-containing protein [Planctomycetes bacterium]|nr:pilus assembly protein N-terminal domain-containing protein [Planctomycetota bacterium]
MYRRVMEDQPNRLQVVLRRRNTIRAIRFLTALGVAAIGTTAVAQTATRGSTFRGQVVDLTDRTAGVTVPLDGSISVVTSVETVRADVVSRHIAEIEVISPTLLLITGQRFGTTSVVLTGADQQQYVFHITVELDLERLNAALPEIDPLSNAKATSFHGHIVLTGTVSAVLRAERMVELARLFLPVPITERPTTTVQNHLEVAHEQQVMIRCVVAEMSRSALRALGINGFLVGENVRDVFLVNQLGGINPINIGVAADALVTQNVQFLTGENGIPLGSVPTLSLGFPRAQAQFFIKAMADNSLLSILAEPNLVAISGETASFLAGGEFPIPVPQGNQQVTIQFREFGVRLNFTPIVRRNQMIRLRVAPEVSQLDTSVAIQIEGFVVPGLTTRSIETTVELASGQTIAIAGLLNEQVRGIASRIPGIGDLPVLGALFRSVQFQRSLSELVILVTPEIIAPLEAHQLVRLPTDGQVDPTDAELYGLGLLEGSRAKAANDADGGPSDHSSDRPTALGSEPEQVSLHGPWGLAGISSVRQ